MFRGVNRVSTAFILLILCPLRLARAARRARQARHFLDTRRGAQGGIQCGLYACQGLRAWQAWHFLDTR
eukprot:170109-Pyramimonas_sp.AAC.1